MKNLVVLFVAILVAFSVTEAQTNSLIIKMKSGKTETIDLSKLSKIQFSEINSVEDSVKPVLIKSNYPNPFSNNTNIDFEMLHGGYVEINIYDNFGRLVFANPNYVCSSGLNRFQWNGTDLNGFKVNSGVYFAEIGNNSKKQRTMLVLVN